MPGLYQGPGEEILINTILTDIEGTTSSLSFVKDVLFPYARERMGDFVRAHKTDPQVIQRLEQVRIAAGAAPDTEQLIEQLRRWIDEDQKIPPLKALQGMIWREAYESGDLKGHVYDDAVQYLKKWKNQGLRLFVFSSGSVLAQKLLFGHSVHGDLTPLFSGYFDTNIGAKKDAQAYRRIAAHIAAAAGDILFLSDVPDELDAARAAGMATTLLVRDVGTRVRTDASHPQANDFAAITF